MTLNEVLSEAQALSRADKLRLIRVLAHELEHEEGLIEPNRSYPIWSPDQAFSAAAVLLEALNEHQGQP
jgi:hypothetical protein